MLNNWIEKKFAYLKVQSFSWLNFAQTFFESLANAFLRGIFTSRLTKPKKKVGPAAYFAFHSGKQNHAYCVAKSCETFTMKYQYSYGRKLSQIPWINLDFSRRVGSKKYASQIITLHPNMNAPRDHLESWMQFHQHDAEISYISDGQILQFNWYQQKTWKKQSKILFNLTKKWTKVGESVWSQELLDWC